MSDDQVEEIRRLVTEGFARVEGGTRRLADAAHLAANRALELSPRVGKLEDRQRRLELRVATLDDGGFDFEVGGDEEDD